MADKEETPVNQEEVEANGSCFPTWPFGVRLVGYMICLAAGSALQVFSMEA